MKIKLLILLLIFIFTVSCNGTMTQLHEDLSTKLTDYTECPTSPVFNNKLQELAIDGKDYVAMTVEDFDTLDKYVVQLEVCTRKRLMDIVKRNEIIQDLIKGD